MPIPQSPEDVLEPPELELQGGVNCLEGMLGTELGYPLRHQCGGLNEVPSHHSTGHLNIQLSVSGAVWKF